MFPTCSCCYENKQGSIQANSTKISFCANPLRDSLRWGQKPARAEKRAKMLVFWDQRLVFLATPKTGSTAIAAALEPLASVSVQRPPVLKHTTVHRFRRFLGPYLEAASKTDWTVVALMREPRDWLGSWYRFRARDEPADSTRSTQAMSFDDFVQGWCRDPRPEYADVGSQAKFLRPRQGQGADRLFRYEDRQFRRFPRGSARLRDRIAPAERLAARCDRTFAGNRIPAAGDGGRGFRALCVARAAARHLRPPQDRRSGLHRIAGRHGSFPAQILQCN
jgi:hypothetical protein